MVLEVNEPGDMETLRLRLEDRRLYWPTYKVAVSEKGTPRPTMLGALRLMVVGDVGDDRVIVKG